MTATVLFACVHNAGRSQMAAAWFGALADPTKARAISAGTAPASRVHPEVVLAMGEVGIDLAGCTPQRLTDDLARRAQLLVTMGCGDACPALPGLERDDWPLPDPKGKTPAEVRRIRDDLRRRVLELLHARGWSRVGRDALVSLARRWLACFATHDVDALVALYAADARHTSPKIRALHPETGGFLVGRAALFDWWSEAFQRLPDLCYEERALTAEGTRVFMEYVRRVPGEPEMAVAEVLEVDPTSGLIAASRVYHG